MGAWEKGSSGGPLKAEAIWVHNELMLSPSPSPSGTVLFMGKSEFLCRVEDRSFILRDSCRLKGEELLLRAGNPLKEPCLARTSTGACLRGITWGPRGGEEEEGDGGPGRGATAWFTTPSLGPEERAMEGLTSPSFLSCNCLMTSSRSAASVAVVTRNEPSLVKVVLLASKVAVTPHSFSLFCFLSRQAAKAQPTEWLRRSPESLIAMKQ